MNHDAALIELAAAVTRLSDSIAENASLLQALCERMARDQERWAHPSPARDAQAPVPALRLIEGGPPRPVAT